MITNLCLIRHADFRADATEADPPISKLGLQQCQKLKTRLESSGELADFSVLVSSSMNRAIQTAESIAHCIGKDGCDRVETDQLREMHWGAAEGLGWDEMTSRFGSPRGQEQPFAPGGESWKTFVARCTNEILRIAEVYAGRSIVIVAHTGVIEASFVRLASLKSRSLRFDMTPSNTGITQWSSSHPARERAWRLDRYNDCSHLWDNGEFLHTPESQPSSVEGNAFWRAVGADVTTEIGPGPE